MRLALRKSGWGGCGAAAAVLLLAACTTTTHRTVNDETQTPDQPVHLKESEIHTDLIRQMLVQGQYYAALANIEELKRSSGETDELVLLEADTRRHLGQDSQSELLYRRLLSNSKYSAQAYHGLGMLYVHGNLDNAIRNFQHAVEQAPTDVDFRNDLGYALMEAGRYTDAQLELSTAAELAPEQEKSRNNLIILYLLAAPQASSKEATQRLEGALQRLTAKVTPEEMQKLRGIAQSIRDEQNARAAKAAG
jgi:Flp pilus assembly protein TadD